MYVCIKYICILYFIKGNLLDCFILSGLNCSKLEFCGLENLITFQCKKMSVSVVPV